MIFRIFVSLSAVSLIGAMARDENEMEDDEDLQTSAEFYAHYEAKEILGKGMSSTVRRCIEKSSGKEFAVKILDVSTEKSTEDQAKDLRESALREIRVLRILAGHKNIIELHDFYETPTFLFIVFELARGGELFDYLTRVVTLSEKKTRSLMRQIFEAVEVMHSYKVVHRDLKPENILMIDDDTLKVTDYGFAYELKDGELLTELCGTPGYLAPEVLKTNMYETGGGYRMEVDLWACGVIMYTLLCGYAPFYHRKQIYMLRSISEGKYQFRSPEWDEIGEAAKDLIRHLLVVDPNKRYTAKQALAHPFFHAVPVEELQPVAIKFNARKAFKLAIIRVRLLVRMQRIKYLPLMVPATALKANPYATRKIRRQIDAAAFRIYGHWVKKGREQYRDALFANAIKVEELRRT